MRGKDIAIRDRSDRVVTANRWIALGLGLFAFALLLGTAGGYGLTYDEPVYSSRAFRAGEWLRLLTVDPGQALSAPAINRYWDATGDEQAGLMKLVGWAGTALTAPLVTPLAAIRAGTALVVAGLVAALYLFVAGMWGRAAGVFAALGLLLMPRVFAHCHLFTMDAPVMAFSFLSVAAYFLYARTQADGSKGHITWLVLGGLAFGAALATKVNGFFVPAIVLPWLLLYRRRALLPGLASMVVLGPLVFFLTWPWLWHDTVERLARYLSFFGQHYPVHVMYFGETYLTAPWHYAMVMLLITTPVVFLIFAVWGSVAGWRREVLDDVQDWTASLPGLRRAALALMLWAVVVNLLPSSLPFAPKYNGVRLFLPVFAPLIVLAAAGFADFYRRAVSIVADEGQQRRIAIAVVFLVALTPGLYATARSLPYGMSYYNVLIGYTGGAVARGMEATYWGDAYFAAVPWLNENAPPDARVWISVSGFVSSVQMYQTFGYLRPDLRLTGGEEAFDEANLLVVMNKPTEMGEEARELVRTARPLFVESLWGAPLVWVFPGKGVEPPEGSTYESTLD